MSHSHADFELPGLSCHGFAKLNASIAFAHSGRWNSRKLENHFYSFWNLVLVYLVHDLVDTIVIPQFQFDTVDGGPVAPDDSISTTAQPDSKEITPDFAIAMLNLVRRETPPTVSDASTTFNSWLDIKVQHMQIPLITEVKRPPTRRERRFRQHLETQLLTAQGDLIKQAYQALLMQPSLNKILLMGCSGEWWCWTVATRAALFHTNIGGDVLFEEAEEAGPFKIPDSRTREHLPRASKNILKGAYVDKSPSPPSESEKMPYMPHRGEQEEQPEGGGLETIKDNAEDAMPADNEWSLPIRFGSHTSAQHFFLVHRFLKEQQNSQGAEDPEDAG
jgi:hypothetical protein